MILKTKDGYWIEGDDSHEFVVPHGHRPNFVLDDWCGMTQEELQEIINKFIEDKLLSALEVHHEDY